MRQTDVRRSHGDAELRVVLESVNVNTADECRWEAAAELEPTRAAVCFFNAIVQLCQGHVVTDSALVDLILFLGSLSDTCRNAF